MSIQMWQEMQDLKARIEAVEQRLLQFYRSPELETLKERLDKFEKALGKYAAPKRG